MPVDRNASDKLRLRRNAQREAAGNAETALVWKGDYSGTTTYQKQSVVMYLGKTYVAIATTQGNLPTDTSRWAVLAAGGLSHQQIMSRSSLGF